MLLSPFGFSLSFSEYHLNYKGLTFTSTNSVETYSGRYLSMFRYKPFLSSLLRNSSLVPKATNLLIDHLNKSNVRQIRNPYAL